MWTDTNPDPDACSPSSMADEAQWGIDTGGFWWRYYTDTCCADNWYYMQIEWPGNDWPPSEPGWFILDGSDCGSWFGDSYPEAAISIPWEHIDVQNEYPNYTETFYAHTTMSLRTGGPAGSSQQNLWKVQTSAAPIAGTNITVLGKMADENGAVFKLLADNTSNDVTPSLPAAFKSYGFDMTATKATLQIMRGETNNITDSTNTVVVGEQMALSCVLSPGIATVTNFQWSIPGSYISNYVTTTTLGKVYPLTNAAAFTNSGITYYWVEGSGGSLLEVQCTAKVKGETITAKTKFNVVAPTYELQICPSNTVGIHLPYVLGSTYFHFGDGTNGIHFFGNPQVLVESNFTLGFIQVGKSLSQRFFDGGTQAQRVYTNTWFLDCPVPDEFLFQAQLKTNATFGSFANALYAFDSPSQYLFPALTTMNRITRSDNFELFLMYKPGNGGIWVPLVHSPWSWSGTAVWTNSQWTLTASSYSPTNCTSASGSGAGTFPIWSVKWLPTVESNWVTF
jgi:hypothetical protein